MAMTAAGALIFLLSPAANYLAARAKAHAFLSAHPEIQNIPFILHDNGPHYNPRYRYSLLDPRTDALAREHLVLEFKSLGVIETSESLGVIQTTQGEPFVSRSTKVLSIGCSDFGGVPGWVTTASVGLFCAGLVLGGMVLTNRTNGGAVV